jgi:hypothetical protein
MNDTDTVPTMADLLGANIPPKSIRPWLIDRDLGVLLHDDGSGYGIPLSRLTEPAGLVWWLRHIADKSWGTDEVLGALVRAYIVLNPGWR